MFIYIWCTVVCACVLREIEKGTKGRKREKRREEKEREEREVEKEREREREKERQREREVIAQHPSIDGSQILFNATLLDKQLTKTPNLQSSQNSDSKSLRTQVKVFTTTSLTGAPSINNTYQYTTQLGKTDANIKLVFFILRFVYQSAHCIACMSCATCMCDKTLTYNLWLLYYSAYM